MNILQGRANLARCIEIALLGELSIFLYIDYLEEKVPDEKELEDFKSAIPQVKWVDNLDEADIINVYDYINPSDLLKIKHKSETLENIMNRVNNHIHITYEPDSYIAQESSKALLKVACDRLNLTLKDTKKIDVISQVIANSSQSKNIRVEHLAEAIQYRPKPQLEKLKALKVINEVQDLMSNFFTSEIGAKLYTSEENPNKFEIFSKYMINL